MSLALTQRVKDLEKKVAELERKIAAPQAATPSGVSDSAVAGQAPAVAAISRNMCPKCGVRPAYHFHVVNCKGNANVA